MFQTWKQDIHDIGEFNIQGHNLQGEIVYREDGKILLILKKTLRHNNSFDLTGMPVDDMPVILGKLNTGVCVKLYNAKLINSKPYIMSHQQICYLVDYILETTENRENERFTQFTFKVENGVEWSGLSGVQTNIKEIKFSEHKQITVNWFNEKIVFYTTTKSPLWSYPKQESFEIEERLKICIESQETHELPYFFKIRDKILAIISFATRSNVNILDQYVEGACENIETDFHVGGRKVITSEPFRPINPISPQEYNFKLANLIDNGIQETDIDNLTPIFNLYLSLFKYQDMPLEMRFLNIVQAVESFHARFFSNGSKSEHKVYIEKRYGTFLDYEEIRNLLLPDDLNDNITHITLVARLNELLFDNGSKVFYRYYVTDKDFAQTIVRTRNYYTHYDPKLEKYALKGDELRNAIKILRVILEYHICKLLGVNKAAILRSELS